MFVLSWRRARERETRFSKTTWRGDGRKLRHDGPECPEVAHLAPPVRDLAHYLPRDFRPLLLARGRVPATYGPGKEVGGSRKKVVSLGPESPSQKERHHTRGGPGTPSPPPSLPLSLSRCTSGKLPLPPVRTGSLRTHHRVRRTLPCLFTSRMNSIIFGPLRSVPNCHHRLRPPPPRLAYQPPVP